MGIELGAKNLYKAYGVPALDLTFADKKSLVDRISGNNLITFTRSSVGTYVGADGLIKTAGNNVPRFDHNPATGESLGLLVEEARANLVTYGSSIQNWSNTASWNIVSANATTAPDGTITATSIIPNVGQPSQMANAVSNNEKVLSVFAKANGYNHLIIVAQSAPSTSAGVLFNLTGSGSIVATNYGATGIIQSLPNGWYRCTMVRSASDAATMNTFSLRTANSSTPTDSYWFQPGFAGDGTSGIYLWGAQLEAGSFPTSYIPTTTSTVTRAADVASMTGTNFSTWYNNTEGTFVTDAILAFTQNAGNPFTFGGVFYTIINDPSGLGAIRTLGNGTIMSSGLSNSLTSFSKTAVALKSGDFAIGRGGSITGTSSTAYTPTGSQWAINSSLGSLAVIKRLAYYPVRLPNATLQALTQ